MDIAFLTWAKLGDRTWPDEYHPLICHLIDVGQVARRLWAEVFRPRVREWVADRLGLPTADAAGAWLAFWAATHDIGKMSPGFQHRGAKTEALRCRLEREFEFNFYVGDRLHGDLGTKVLADSLAEFCQEPKPAPTFFNTLAVAVGGHHGVFPTDWDRMSDVLGNAQWTVARRDLLAQLARLFGVCNQPPPRPRDGHDQSVWMFVAGLTSVADWIGSNKEFFPSFGNATRVNDPAFVFDADTYFADAAQKAGKALDVLGWFGQSNSNEAATFRQLFPHISTPRPLQEAVESLVNEMPEPGLMIVEAPMGEGKTEAAWFAAASWSRRGGQGAYVALPTMATSNQMFERVGKFLESGPGKKNLMLLHGKAAMNEQFEKLKDLADVYDEDRKPSVVVAESWFAANKKQSLLAPFGVGTIDQALLAVLQTKHVFVRLFGLAGKCVILDEVHAYDAYMTTLMERLLRWLAALGCPVVLLSATLPKEKRLKLLRAYGGDDVSEPNDMAYPRITSVVGKSSEARQVEADSSRAQTIQLDWLSEANLVDHLKTALAQGGCAVVIRNTVGLAQDTYRQLRDALKSPDFGVELFHARFPFGRRQQIENDVLRWFGRTKDDTVEGNRVTNAPQRPKKMVLVATQVVEQSLDLDFDVMISDVAPVDLVLQRAGRLWRHERGQRPSGCAEPRLWLIEPDMKGELPDFGKGSEYVYARYILLKSYLVLKAGKTIQLPDQLERFVEQVYGNETLAIPLSWQAELLDCESKLREEQRGQRSKAKGLMVPRPDAENLLHQPNAQLEEDNPEVADKIRAATRDTQPTIKLIVVYQIDGQDYLDPEGHDLFEEAHKPNVTRIRRLLENEVTINRIGCVMFYAKHHQVPAGWRKSGMLRFHRVLRVDREGKAIPGHFSMRLDPDMGIEFID